MTAQFAAIVEMVETLKDEQWDFSIYPLCGGCGCAMAHRDARGLPFNRMTGAEGNIFFEININEGRGEVTRRVWLDAARKLMEEAKR